MTCCLNFSRFSKHGAINSQKLHSSSNPKTSIPNTCYIALKGMNTQFITKISTVKSMSCSRTRQHLKCLEKARRNQKKVTTIPQPSKAISKELKKKSYLHSVQCPEIPLTTNISPISMTWPTNNHFFRLVEWCANTPPIFPYRQIQAWCVLTALATNLIGWCATPRLKETQTNDNTTLINTRKISHSFKLYLFAYGGCRMPTLLHILGRCPHHHLNLTTFLQVLTRLARCRSTRYHAVKDHCLDVILAQFSQHFLLFCPH